MRLTSLDVYQGLHDLCGSSWASKSLDREPRGVEDTTSVVRGFGDTLYGHNHNDRSLSVFLKYENLEPPGEKPLQTLIKATKSCETPYETLHHKPFCSGSHKPSTRVELESLSPGVHLLGPICDAAMWSAAEHHGERRGLSIRVFSDYVRILC